MEKALQERLLGMLPSNTVTNPHVELNAINTRSSLTMDGHSISHFNSLVYREEEQESETITEVVEIPSSQSTPLVSPPETPPLIDTVDSIYNKFHIQNNQSSSRTTSHFDHSLPDYEAFYFDVDHKKEKSSGSTTSHFDPSLLEYESFYFDVDLKECDDLLYYDPLIDPPLIAERSDSHHEEFADELAHIISSPKYDHFYFDIEADPGELTRLLNGNPSSENINLNKITKNKELKFQTLTKFPTSHELNVLRILLSGNDSALSKELSETNHLVSFPFGNKDKNFNPGIHIINGVQSKRSPILPLNVLSPILSDSDLLSPKDSFEIDHLL
uniref:Reverse transcriptase domain-containing protein n=1 Tax=Tanacetum cinerariifolium TaxID=118510 RepID=A0A6L2MN21_TANCI|nr:hypothetical protein [Tanacetum cinerariifolium]